MTREMREHYLLVQVQHERRGEWEQANRVNLWLVGAFMTRLDVMDDNVPPVRRHFLRRLWKAGVI
jgi:hypothetical protein